MYRLLIVDDEPIIVDGLFELFNDIDTMDLDIYKAYSGAEALAWLNRTRVDIVLTDISMPGIDGLKLLEKIKENWPFCKVIFLTGYNEFNYIYKAIKYEGVKYILKTENDEVIVKAVSESIDEIEKDFQVKNFLSVTGEKFKNNKIGLRKDFVNGILSSKHDFTVNQEQFNILEIPLSSEKKIVLLIGKVDERKDKILFADKIKELSAIEAINEKYFSKNIKYSFSIFEHSILVWLMQPNEDEDWDKAILFIKGSIEQIQSVCNKELNLSLSFILENKPFEIKLTEERFSALRLLLYYNMGKGKEIILADNNIFGSELEKNLDINDMIQKVHFKLRKVEVLKTYLESGMKQEFKEILSDLLLMLKDTTLTNNDLSLEIYLTLFSMILSYINEWNLSKYTKEKMNVFNIIKYDGELPIEIITNNFYEITDIIFEAQMSMQKSSTENKISIVNKYINENISGDISLVKLSEIVYLNPNYLSRFYKQVCGRNITNYVNEVKLKVSKQLLADNKFKIYEITKMVGFDSPAYFTRFFKKAVNKSPQEYRNSIIK